MKSVKIISAVYLEDYKILLLFNDNKSLTIDFQELLQTSPFGNEKKYLQKELFQQFKIELGDLIWNDYDMCFQAKNLYQGILRKRTFLKSSRPNRKTSKIIQNE
ncbi:MAG: hypothetical protein HW421_243 [Ignavibacteria bacterium]|nr:hypothetical protein [Ignavibacteria bacterium]